MAEAKKRIEQLEQESRLREARNREIADLERRLDELIQASARIEKMNRRLKELEVESQGKTGLVLTLQIAEAGVLGYDIGELTRNYPNLESRIASLKSELATLKSRR